ncbi:MAG TPA: hypothetical protein DF610_02645 [Sphingobacterium sp.]|nr:hypothetical protein [Sphingobacterium sp.]
MKRILLALCLPLLLTSCKSKQAVVSPSSVITNTVEKIVTKTLRDTTFLIKSDSSFYEAWIECQNGKPVLRNPTAQGGKSNLQPPQVSLNDKGQLDVGCVTDSLVFKARLEELVTALSNIKTTTIRVPVDVVKPLTFFQTLFINLGKVFCVILMVAIGYGAFKLIKK